MANGDGRMRRGLLCLTSVLAMAGLAFAGERGVRELPTVRGLEDLRGQPAHHLPTGWEVRLGLGDGGDAAGPWKLLYCLARYVGDGEPALHFDGAAPGKMLGPIFYTVTAGEARRARAMMAIAATAERAGLYCAVVPTAWRGDYQVRVFSPAAAELARRTLRIADAQPCHWAQFARTRERLVAKGEAPWRVRRQVAAAVPDFGGTASLLPPMWDNQQSGLRRLRTPLPGEVPCEWPWPARLGLPRLVEEHRRQRNHTLELSLDDGAFTIRARSEIIPWADLHLLARWWRNGKPVVPPRSDEGEMVQLGRAVAAGRTMKIAFGLPDFLGRVKVGDRIGLQVLHTPGAVRRLPKTRAAQAELLKAQFAIRRDVPRVLLLSNRLNFELTARLLELPLRRQGRRETDF